MSDLRYRGPHHKGRFTPEEIGEMARLYFEELFSLKEVAKQFDCDHTTVRNVFNKHGLRTRSFKEALWAKQERERRAISRAIPPKHPSLLEDLP